MGEPSFFIEALGIPFIVLVGNSGLRWCKKLPQSAAADVVLIFIVFNGIVAIHAKELADYVPNVVFKSMLQALYVAYIIICCFLWAISLNSEEKVHETRDHSAGRYRSNLPLRHLAITFSISLFVTTASVTPFIYKG
jgi:hypothetical protein